MEIRIKEDSKMASFRATESTNFRMLNLTTLVNLKTGCTMAWAFSKTNMVSMKVTSEKGLCLAKEPWIFAMEISILASSKTLSSQAMAATH